MSDPIFSVRREDGWRLPDMRATGVRQAAVGGGVLLVSTSDGRIVRWTGAGLSADDDTGAIPGPELVEVERRGSEFRVHNLFVDPSGYHALISAVLAGVGFTYYLGGTSSNAAAASRSGGGAAKLQAREVPALRTVIESVAWNAARGADDSRVGPLLVGTSNGRVLEVRIENKRDASAERVWELPDAYAQPLSCLRLEQFAQASADKPSRYFAMAVTAGPPLRCFYFNGGPTLGGMFASSGTTAASTAAGGTPGGGAGGTPAGAKQALLFTEVRTEPKLSALQASGAAAASGASARGYPTGGAASGGASSTASSAAAVGGSSVAPGGGFPLGSRSDAGSARGGSFTSQASAAGGGVPASLPVAAHLGSPDLQLYVTSPGAATAPGGPAASGTSSSASSTSGPSARGAGGGGGPGSLQQLRAGTALRPDVFALLSSAGLLVGRLNLTAAAAGASALATSSGSLAGGSTGTVDPAAAAVTANNAVVSGLQLISYPPVSSGSTGSGSGTSGVGGSGGAGSLGSPGGASGGFGSLRGSEYGPQGQLQQQQHADSASGGSGAGAVAGGAGQRHIVTNPADFPLSVAITDYHYLLLFRHRLVAVSRVSQEVVQELPLPEERCGAMRGMCVDGALAAGITPRSFSSGVLGGAAGASAGVSGIGSGIWLFSDRGVFSLRITGEDRDVWRLLLRRGDFDAALAILDAAAAASATLGSNPFGAPAGASGGGGFGGGFGGMPSLASLLDGPGGLAAAAAPLGLSGAELARRREQVRAAQAEYLMGRGAYDAAARAWREAPSAVPFEEVCLKFIHAGAHAALQAYVGYKLASLTPVEEGGTLVAASSSAGSGGGGGGAVGGGGNGGNGGSGSGARALKVQRTVLCTWLTEMYLSRLHTLAGAAAAKPGAPYPGSGGGGAARAVASTVGSSTAGGIAPATGLAAFGGGASLSSSTAASGASGGSGGNATASAAYEALIADFKRFLTTYRSSLDKATTLDLLASHGRSDELLFFCTLCRDYDRVVAHHLQRRDYKAALEALRRVPALSPSFEELWYVHSPLLMQHLPRATADAWREAAERAGGVGGGGGGADAAVAGGGGLDPVRLIPAMVRYEQTRYAALNAIAAGAASPSGGPAGFPAALGGPSSASAAAAAAGGATGGLPFSIEASADFAGGMDVALAFCEWIVARGGRGSRDRALHNFLLSLYAQQPLEELCCAYIDGQTEGMGAVPSGTHRYAAGGSAALSPLALPPASGFGSAGGVRAGGFETYHTLQDAAADGATGGSGGNPFGGDGGGDGGDGTTGGSGRPGPAFDLQFAVRVCLSERKYRACAKLFTAMGLHAEAVETALTVAAHTLAEERRSTAAAAAAAAAASTAAASAAARGIRGVLAASHDANNDANEEIDFHGLTRLARAAANAIPDVERELPLRKKVWLRIAAWLVAHGGGAQEVLSVLQDSGGALKVDDVLPVFPSASIINEFKAGVASSLAETQRAITGLVEEMRGYQDAADRIRNDIRSLRGRCAYVRGGQRCEMCAAPLLSAPFYVFPCSHAFHRDCLLAEVLRHLTAPQRRNVEALVLDVARVSAAVDMHLTGGASAPASAAGGGGVASGAAGGKGGVLFDPRGGKGGRRGSGGAGGLLAGMKGIGGGSSSIASLLGGAGSGGGRDGSNVTAALAARLTAILPKAATAALGTSGAAGAALMHVAAAAASASTGELVAALVRKRESLQAALDKGIAGECLYCGDIMIYSVAEPLSLNSVGAARHVAGGGAMGAGGGGTVDEDDDWDV